MARNTIVIRDLSTGAGRTGLDVKLKKYPDWSVVYQATEVSGKPGVYSIEDLPYSRYKLFVNDEVETSFDNGSPDGRFFGGRISELVTDLDMTAHRIINVIAAIDAYDAVNKSQLDIKLNKSGDTMSGNLDMATNRIKGLPTNQGEQTDPSDAAAVGLVLGVNSYIGQNYLSFPPNTILVHPSFSDIAGKKSSSIQGAINYAQSQIPSINNQFNIIILPSLTYPDYTETIILQPFIHLTGLNMVKINGNISGGNANTKLKNIFIHSSGNITLENLRCQNCIFSVQNTGELQMIITLLGNSLMNCIFLSIPTRGDRILSNGGNIILPGCAFTKEFTPNASDKSSDFSILDPLISHLNF